MKLGRKLFAIIMAEVSGAVIFPLLIVLVSILKAFTQDYPVSKSVIILIWVIYIIGMPIVVYVLSMLEDLNTKR